MRLLTTLFIRPVEKIHQNGSSDGGLSKIDVFPIDERFFRKMSQHPFLGASGSRSCHSVVREIVIFIVIYLPLVQWDGRCMKQQVYSEYAIAW